MSTVFKREATVQQLTRPIEVIPRTKSELFFNRELSVLEFHGRVLAEAFEDSNPVLERLKFLSIFSSNLDEFFVIRVSGLKEEMEHQVVTDSTTGESARASVVAHRGTGEMFAGKRPAQPRGSRNIGRQLRLAVTPRERRAGILLR